MKKICLILLIISLFTVPLITSCSQNANTDPTEKITGSENDILPGDDNSGVEEVKPPRPELDLPDVKFDGYDFRVLNWSQADMSWIFTNIVAEEETGAEVNDAVYRRNALVEERFDINIVEITGGWELAQTASRSIQSGSDDYDLVMVQTMDAVGMAQKNMLYDYNALPYVDLTQPWWDRDMVRDLSIGGHSYFVTGDFSLAHYDNTIGMFFNKKLIRDLNLESPYNIIKEGRWTYDKFTEMTKDASKDLNGDGVFNKDDQYGYLSITHIWLPSFISSAGMRMVGTNETGMHKFMMNDQQFISVYQKLIEIMHNGNRLFDADTAGNHRLQDIMFPNNQALFWSEVVHWATILRDMDADFGIITHPKWDENQTGYYNHVYPSLVMGVPSTTLDIERTGMILEALCYESTDTVIKAYYEVLLKTKVARDNESEAMLDIMFNNRLYSVASIFYNNEIYSPLNSISKKGDVNIVSWIEKQETKINKAIEKNNGLFEN